VKFVYENKAGADRDSRINEEFETYLARITPEKSANPVASSAKKTEDTDANGR
jgi:hypothetical protein